jgi:tetratricopeptide (TPR) repeat protein
MRLVKVPRHCGLLRVASATEHKLMNKHKILKCLLLCALIITALSACAEISDELKATAYKNRGFVYGRFGQHQKEIDDYTKAIELDPKYASLYHYRGFAYLNLGQHRKAIEDFSKAIELAPKLAQAYFDRGLAYAKLGKRDLADKDQQKAKELRYKPDQK